MTEWPIDNTIPTLTLPQFPSYSRQCSIGKYQLYSADLSESPVFETTYETLARTSEIEFSLLADLRNVPAAYAYIVRASEITESADVIFDADHMYTFRTVCAEVTFVAPDMEELETYDIDGLQPTLSIPTYTSYSPESCVISRYEIYSHHTDGTPPTLSSEFE